MACNRLIAPDDPRLKVARDGVEPPTPAPRLARRRPARRRRDTGAIRTTTPTAIRPRDDVVVRVQGDMKIGRFGLFQPYAGSSQLWVGGKAKISTSSAVHQAALRTPDMQTKLGRFVIFDGSLCADALKMQRAVQLGCPSP